jgi:hypothetical protein
MAGASDPPRPGERPAEWTRPVPGRSTAPLWRRGWLWVVVGGVVLLFAAGVLTVMFDFQKGGSSESRDLPVPRSPVTAGTASCATNASSCSLTGVILLDAQRRESGATCIGAGVNKDIRAGAKVTVTDTRDRTVGTAILGDGVEANGQCVFKFVVAVPSIDSYNVAVNGRAPLTFPRTTLDDQGWALTLSVG